MNGRTGYRILNLLYALTGCAIVVYATPEKITSIPVIYRIAPILIQSALIFFMNSFLANYDKKLSAILPENPNDYVGTRTSLFYILLFCSVTILPSAVVGLITSSQIYEMTVNPPTDGQYFFIQLENAFFGSALLIIATVGSCLLIQNFHNKRWYVTDDCIIECAFSGKFKIYKFSDIAEYSTRNIYGYRRTGYRLTLIFKDGTTRTLYGSQVTLHIRKAIKKATTGLENYWNNK